MRLPCASMNRAAAKNQWFVVAAYALLAATSQLLWLTFAPITTEASLLLNVSDSAVGWLAEIFPLTYVLLAIPAGILLDRWMRQTLIAAGVLMFGGAALRLVGDGFSVILAGQVLIAIAQPAVVTAVTKLSAESVSPEYRTLAISIGSAGTFLGIVAALVLGATVGSQGEMEPLLVINLVVAIAAMLGIAVALRRPLPGTSDEAVSVGFHELRRLYSDPVLGRLGTLIFVGMGVFNALATWLEVLLSPSGVTSSAASWMLVVTAVAGIAGAILIAPWVAARSREQVYLQFTALVGGIVFAAFAVIEPAAINYVLLAVLGFLLLGAQPVLLEISERRAGRTAASAAGALFLAGNLGGIVLAVIVQTVNSKPSVAFALLALAMLVIAPIAHSLKPGFNAPMEQSDAA